MNKEENNLDNNKISNDQQFLRRIVLIISLINFVFCLVSACIIGHTYYSHLFSTEPGSYSGWFLPITIGIYISACIPDATCLRFSILYNSKKKNIFPVLIIICSIIGCIIMNSNFITELLLGLNILQLIYTILKIIIILFNIIILIQYQKVKT